MIKFDHLRLPVTDLARSRDWYVRCSRMSVTMTHPFLVHRATWPHLDSGPRMVAQPEVAQREPFVLREGTDVCAVERAILRGLR